MLNAVSSVTESGRPPEPGSAADVFQRAARTPQVGQPARWAPVAARLRSAAWRLILVRSLVARPGGDGGTGPLMVALAALLAEIAAYQEQRRCLAQASAARASRDALTTRRPPSQTNTHRTGPSRGPGQGRSTRTGTSTGRDQARVRPTDTAARSNPRQRPARGR